MLVLIEGGHKMLSCSSILYLPSLCMSLYLTPIKFWKFLSNTIKVSLDAIEKLRTGPALIQNYFKAEKLFANPRVQ